ncbi:MAG: hypothetical protein VCB81_05390 [Verrucomicrobiia bacterium]
MKRRPDTPLIISDENDRLCVAVRLERSTIEPITPSPISLMLTFLQSQNGEQWLQPKQLGKKDLRVRDSGIRE